MKPVTLSNISGTSSTTRSTVVLAGGATGSSFTVSPFTMRKATGEMLTPAPPPPPPFRPSHALYSSVTGRHAQLQRYRQNVRPAPAPDVQPDSKQPPDAPKAPDSAPQEAP